MKTRTIGEVLREEREQHHVSLEELAQLTRIRVQYLTALESNLFVDLPSAAFVKGYIKTYAQVFGFDHQPLIALLRRDFKESAKGELIPREFIRPVLKNRQLWTPVTLVLMVLVSIFISFTLYVSVQWYQLQRPPFLEITSPQEETVVSSRVVVQGRTLEDAILKINAEPVSVRADGSFQTELFLPREGLNTITIEATDRRGKSNLSLRSVRVKN